MKTLVTGVNGLIGSHLIERLLSLGDEVCLISSKRKYFHKELSGKFKFYCGDITNRDFIASSLIKFKPERVFHFAAQSLPKLSSLEASITFRVNIEGTYNLLTSICDYCPNALVIISGSSAEYAQAIKSTKIKEDFNLEPNSIYGISKLANYHLTKLLHKTRKLKTIYTRPFFIIGPRKIGDVCSDFAQSIVNVERGNANTLFHGNLESTRDFLDIEDCIDALLTLSNLGTIGEVYNICSGKGLKISDLLNELCSFSDHEIKTQTNKKLYRPIDEEIRIGDPSKLNALGWEPKVSTSKTLKKILDYWRKNI